MTTTGYQLPTASLKRWGFLLAAAMTMTVLAACAARNVDVCAGFGETGYSAEPDSLGLDEFTALSAEQRQERRRQARRLAAQARSAGRADRHIRLLTNGAGLAPDDPDHWLRLARIWRWQGDYLATDISLDNAAAAVRGLEVTSELGALRGPGYKESAALETALQRAWLHYDRGEWREALPWVRAALRVEPGNAAVLQIRGLLEARLGRRSKAHEIAADLRRTDAFNLDTAWIMSNLDTSQGRYREAFNFFYTYRPDPRRAAECYRDMGRAAERVEEWSTARQWYRESAAALPYKDISCRIEREHARLSDPTGRRPLPFWLANDRHYVTGSLSSYLAFAFARFDHAADSADKEMWAGLVVNAAGTCLRLGLETPDVRRVRGLVYAWTGRNDRALNDLLVARREFSALGVQRADLEAEIGHLMLLKENHVEAVAYLRRALAAEPDAARVWSDLGLALIMADDRAAAEEALTRAIELDRSLAAAWYNRGLMHLHAGELDQAEADLVQAAQRAPENTDVANLLQQVMLEKRRRQMP